MIERAIGIVAGVAADAVFGDPKRHHPVAIFGNYALEVEKRLYADSVAAGAKYVLATVAPVAICGAAMAIAGRNRWINVAAHAVATWAALGSRSLVAEGEAMADSLEAGDLTAARQRLTHLCSRDPEELGETDLARATVESLAENASDAIVATIFWGAVAGVPGIVAHRAINTLDAMVGYRNPRYENFGKIAARCDDVLGLIPARLTALAIATVAPSEQGSCLEALSIARRDHGNHPSPNGGWPEAAMAGALGVQLGGTNIYPQGVVETRPTLGDGAPPAVRQVRKAARIVKKVTHLAAGAAAVGLMIFRKR